MKTQTGIWIDGSRALIIQLLDGRENIHELTSEIDNHVHHKQEGDKGTFMGEHHVNNERKLEERKNKQIDSYLGKVISEVKGTDELFVMGPSGMKIKLKTRIEKDAQLNARLKAVETTGQLTLNQCVARVKEFFKQE
jgi:hypothetical protein